MCVSSQNPAQHPLVTKPIPSSYIILTVTGVLLATVTQVEHARTMIEERFVPHIEKVKARSPLRPCRAGPDRR